MVIILNRRNLWGRKSANCLVCRSCPWVLINLNGEHCGWLGNIQSLYWCCRIDDATTGATFDIGVSTKGNLIPLNRLTAPSCTVVSYYSDSTTFLAHTATIATSPVALPTSLSSYSAFPTTFPPFCSACPALLETLSCFRPYRSSTWPLDWKWEHRVWVILYWVCSCFRLLVCVVGGLVIFVLGSCRGWLLVCPWSVWCLPWSSCLLWDWGISKTNHLFPHNSALHTYCLPSLLLFPALLQYIFHSYCPHRL